MIEHEGDYCESCGALWPRGQESCAGCEAAAASQESTPQNPSE